MYPAAHVLQEVHNFLKNDPRLPPLETDSVAAASSPQAAEAAAAAAAIQEAAIEALPPLRRDLARKPAPWETPKFIADKKAKEAAALSIIRVRLAGDVAGLRRKRGVLKQQRVRLQGWLVLAIQAWRQPD